MDLETICRDPAACLRISTDLQKRSLRTLNIWSKRSRVWRGWINKYPRGSLFSCARWQNDRKNLACASERVNLPAESRGRRGGCSGETGRHGRGMMDGSHASHCEKIIARCRQLRQCGGRPKGPGEQRPRIPVWVSAGPARGAPNLHIYMRRSRVNCSEFLRWVQSGGCCCFILHNKHAVFTHSSPFPRKLKRRWNKVFQFLQINHRFWHRTLHPKWSFFVATWCRDARRRDLQRG